MSTIPFYFPVPRYVPRLPRGKGYQSIFQWCTLAGIECRASGRWIERMVRVAPGPSAEIVAEASPNDAVFIQMPHHASPKECARYALAALAYALMDGVARESIRGATWARVSAHAGRPSTGQALNTRERQRLFRLRKLSSKKMRRSAK